MRDMYMQGEIPLNVLSRQSSPAGKRPVPGKRPVSSRSAFNKLPSKNRKEYYCSLHFINSSDHPYSFVFRPFSILGNNLIINAGGLYFYYYIITSLDKNIWKAKEYGVLRI